MSDRFKVTALKDVTIFAQVLVHTRIDLGDNRSAMRPNSKAQWIQLRAGESREGLAMVEGIAPQSCLDGMVERIGGVAMVPLKDWGANDLPKEFFGVLRLEAQPASK